MYMNQGLTVREAVYEGAFSTPKTTAGLRQIPLSDGTVRLMVDWKARMKRTEPESLVFSTWSGKPSRRTTFRVAGFIRCGRVAPVFLRPTVIARPRGRLQGGYGRVAKHVLALCKESPF
jgi:hypothetical protein